MQQKERALRLASLHVKGNPVILYNAWDAGSAKAIANAGSNAIATSSWADAAAHGYEDGESIPRSFVEQIVARIVHTVDVPVTVDAEGGYSDDPLACAENIALLVDHGVAGMCETINLPLNVMTMPGLPDARALAGAGVARISHGPGPYLQAMEAVRSAAQSLFAQP